MKCFNEIFPDVNVDVMFVPALFFNSKGSFNNVCLFAKSFFIHFTLLNVKEVKLFHAVGAHWDKRRTVP